MNHDNLQEFARRFWSKGIIVNGLLFSCILYFTSVILSHYYDWDIDQFMYFGSRLANRELAFVREYDDKSIAVHALFIIPFWLKSIRIWYIISILVASITAHSLYKTLSKYESIGKSQALISAMYFVFLMTSTRGGINHINGIAACAGFIWSSYLTMKLNFSSR